MTATRPAPEAAAAPQAGPQIMSHRRILLVIAGLLIGMLLAALDQTIVATALPTIAGDLHGLSHLSWVVTSYLLASTASTPLWGKLGDLYGRKVFFQAAIVIFLLGSVLAGLSTSMIELIMFRALQGMGAGGLIVGAQAIVGDVVSPRDRGRYQGIFGAVFGIASVVGPLIGGFFVQNLSWRWVFYVNLPVGAVALVVTAIVLPGTLSKVPHVIDYLGTVLLAGVSTALVLLTTLGGTTYPWSSAPIVGLAVAAAVLLGAFVLVERRAAEPVLPLSLFRNRIFSATSAVGFVVGFAMFGAITYLPQYMQVVRGVSPTSSGLQLVPLMAGLLLTSVVSGAVISRWGRYKVFPIAGTALMTLGMYLLSHLGVDTSAVASGLYMFVLGVGIGGVMQVLVIAVQNAVEYRDLGTATSGATYFRSIGGSFGTALFGAVFASQLTGNLSHYLSGVRLPPAFSAAAGASPAALATLPATVHRGLVHAYAASMQTVFLVAVPVAALAFALSWLIKEVPLRKSVAATNPADTLAPSAMPAARSSLEELARAISVLSEGSSRAQVYANLAARAGLDLDPRATWTLLRLGEHPNWPADELASHLHVPAASLLAVAGGLEDAGLAAVRDNGHPQSAHAQSAHAQSAHAHSAHADSAHADSAHAEPRSTATARIRLTDRGQQTVDRLVAARREALSQLLSDWSPERHDELSALLARLASDILVDDASEHRSPDTVAERYG